MRVTTATALICTVLGAAAGCGDDAPLPSSGAAYRALNDGEREAAAAACRDREAAAADDVAGDQIDDVDSRALRKRLDLLLLIDENRRRAFYELCAETVPFATHGVEVSFSGATDSGDTFAYQTRSDKPLTIRGTVSPAGRGGYVEARRELGPSSALRAEIGPDGRFVMPTVRLKKIADNSFVVAIHSPPNALRKVRFSAICVDCLASGTPPASN